MYEGENGFGHHTQYRNLKNVQSHFININDGHLEDAGPMLPKGTCNASMGLILGDSPTTLRRQEP